MVNSCWIVVCSALVDCSEVVSVSVTSCSIQSCLLVRGVLSQVHSL